MKPLQSYLSQTGEVEQIMEPEYHGDPMNEQGVLCFQHFGWDIIDSLLKVGFSNAYAVVGYSLNMGFIGPQTIFIAEKH